jgi:streptogramin lyase
MRTLPGFVAGGMLMVLLAACSGASDASTTRPSNHATTGPATASPSSAPVTTPTLPAAIHATNAPAFRLATRAPRKVSVNSPDRLAFAFGSVWAKGDDGAVVRIAPATGKVVARIEPTEEAVHVCQGMGVAGGSVWACPRMGVLVRIDPTTNRVAQTVTARYSSDQAQLVESGGRLWLLDPEGDQLVGVDPATGQPGQAPIELGTRCTETAAGAALVWAACPVDGALLRIDVASGRVTGRVAFKNPRTIAASTHIWVGFDGGLAQVDPATLKVVALYDVFPGFGGGIWADPKNVWVRSDLPPFLTRIDPTAHQITATIVAPSLPSGGHVLVVGTSVWASAFDDYTVVSFKPPPG